jgi:hypothetical protein
VHIYRWDLDKTYLDTDFGSIAGLVRSATEPAHAKRALPGAAALVRALSAQPDTRIAILSGSPTQMRSVLEEKLRLDGVRFDELILKDNLENLRRGRLRAIRGQFGYKLPALLHARRRTESSAEETLFGDDTEADALVYSVYADVVAGRIGAAGVSRVMEAAGAYPDQIDHALEAVAGLEHSANIKRIFIRLDRGVPTARFDQLGSRVVPVSSWWQAALVLAGSGHLESVQARVVLDNVMSQENLDDWAIAALTQDVVRRGHVDARVVDGLGLSPGLQRACSKAISYLREQDPRPIREDGVIDYVALVRQGATTGWTGRVPTE